MSLDKADMRHISVIQSVEELAQNYNLWLCDIWGVLHNGQEAFSSAIEACQKFRSAGGIVILISNAPRPAPHVEQKFSELGINSIFYDGIVTSGDVTRSLIQEYSQTPLFHLGPDYDKVIFHGLDVDLVSQEEAEVVVCTGLPKDAGKPEDYLTLLSELSSKSMPMICANPDIVVEKGDLLYYCAGALAEHYKTLSGQVLYAGKPHSPIYEKALEKARFVNSNISGDKTLCIGDGLKTDYLGAVNQGIDMLYIASAVNIENYANRVEKLSVEILEALFGGNDKLPVAAQDQLRW